MDSLSSDISRSNLGVVHSISDGIVKVTGLSSVSYGGMVYIATATEAVAGMVLNLEKDSVSVVILGNDSEILPRTLVISSGNLMSVPVGESLLGRVVSPLGRTLDAKGSLENTSNHLVEKMAPSIISRSPVNQPLETGLKVVDSMVPIGHGQRELIIGDAKTGKSSVAIDAIMNQKAAGTICIYVAIGQKTSSVARIHKILENRGCMEYSIIVSASSSDPAALQFIAPYSACTMGEYFMDKGIKVLCVYDDLSKHAVAYRQLSLLLRRPPGREGYPGDVFYLHSRLLERSANLLNAGSLTALPIIETIQGDVSAYIPTNVISITDGQIFLETELFARGIRPAVSPGLSVSRVGSAAQSKVIKGLSGSMKLELAQFREVEGFTKLGLVLDDATKLVVDNGQKLTQSLVQNRSMPLVMGLQIIFLYSIIKGFLGGIDASKVSLYEKLLFSYVQDSFFWYFLARLLPTQLEEGVLVYLLYNFQEKFKEYL